MEKYRSFIVEINLGLEKFSDYLQPQFKLQPLDLQILDDSKACWNLTSVGWDDTRFPNGNSAGVYFIFGKRRDQEDLLGVYIGKASHNSAIGYRLYMHLHNAERGSKIYPMRDKTRSVFLLEYVLTIPMDGIYFMASALEEFLIYHLQEQGGYLINAVGKK